VIMFRVRQAATGASGESSGQGPFNQKVSQLVQSTINLQANGLNFSAPDALQLSLPLLKSKAPMLALKKPAVKRHVFCGSDFAKEVMKASFTSTATPTSLALPKYFIDPSEDASGIMPRSFYHHSDLMTVAPLEDLVSTGGAAASIQQTQFGDKPRYPWPRCGSTGLFFRREEVVDNLTQAAIALQFTSPFWVPESHPQLGKFLQLKPGAQPIVVSITSSIAPVEVVKILPPQLITMSLKSVKYQKLQPNDKHSPFQNANVAVGTNIFTGEELRNPFVCSDAFQQHEALSASSLPANNRGVWISLDQFVRHGLALRDELVVASASDADADADASLITHIERLLRVFVPVETKQLVLFNGDQFVVPGRLALKSRAAANQIGDVIEVFQ
jgi:hypothetical protein